MTPGAPIPGVGVCARHEVVLGDAVFIIEGPADPDEAVREAVRASSPRPPHWGHLWPMSLALARWVRTSLLVGPGTRVLEVGCGLGLVGIVASSRQASVTMTDIDRDALQWAAHNARLNGVETECVAFDWNDPRPPAPEPDLLLASDVLYEPGSHDAVAQLIARVGCPAVLADPVRRASQAAESAFAARGLRFTTSTVPGGRIMLVRAP